MRASKSMGSMSIGGTREKNVKMRMKLKEEGGGKDTSSEKVRCVKVQDA